MNILMLCYQGDVAGSTYSIQALAKLLADRGHKVYLGCRSESLLFKLLSNSSVQLIAIPFRGKADLYSALLIRKAIRQHHIEVVNPQASHDRYLTSLALFGMRKRPVVVHTRRQRPRSDGGRLQSLFYMHATDRIVAVSKSVKNQLIAKGIDAGHIEVIYNGTPVEKYAYLNADKTNKLREQFDIKPSDIVIGCVARPKRQQQLLKSMAFIPFPVKLIFVGMERTAQMAALENTIPTHHSIHYTGIIPPQEALNYYPLFTVHVLPSISEGLSQALLEAMAIGIPVVATAASGNLDLIQNEENGLLYENDHAEQLAHQLIRLIKDTTLRTKLIKAGKKTALEDFSLEKTGNRYEAFFEELIRIKKAQQKTD